MQIDETKSITRMQNDEKSRKSEAGGRKSRKMGTGGAAKRQQNAKLEKSGVPLTMLPH